MTGFWAGRHSSKSLYRPSAQFLVVNRPINILVGAAKWPHLFGNRQGGPEPALVLLHTQIKVRRIIIRRPYKFHSVR